MGISRRPYPNRVLSRTLTASTCMARRKCGGDGARSRVLRFAIAESSSVNDLPPRSSLQSCRPASKLHIPLARLELSASLDPDKTIIPRPSTTTVLGQGKVLVNNTHNSGRGFIRWMSALSDRIREDGPLRERAAG